MDTGTPGSFANVGAGGRRYSFIAGDNGKGNEIRGAAVGDGAHREKAPVKAIDDPESNDARGRGENPKCRFTQGDNMNELKIPFQTPGEARDYLAKEIDRMMQMQSGKGAPTSRTRIRALASSLDTWQKLYKLDMDTDELRKLQEDIEELKRSLKTGPAGVVNGGKD